MKRRSFIKRLGFLSALMFVRPVQALESVEALEPQVSPWWSSNINGTSEPLTLEVLQKISKVRNPSMNKPDCFIVSLAEYRRAEETMRRLA